MMVLEAVNLLIVCARVYMLLCACMYGFVSLCVCNMCMSACFVGSEYPRAAV